MFSLNNFFTIFYYNCFVTFLFMRIFVQFFLAATHMRLDIDTRAREWFPSVPVGTTLARC
jgi:hypothetical protein